MSGLVPDNAGVGAHYWLQEPDGPPVPWRWDAKTRSWTMPLRDWDAGPGEMARWGMVFATVNGVECRHPIPGPAALNRMHAPGGEMIAAGGMMIDADGGPDDIFAAMLKEAMK